MLQVVICFRISIFEPLKTTVFNEHIFRYKLWFAFELVSLNHWKQLSDAETLVAGGCDLLSN